MVLEPQRIKLVLTEVLNMADHSVFRVQSRCPECTKDWTRENSVSPSFALLGSQVFVQVRLARDKRPFENVTVPISPFA
jgi:hypothetical protein